MKQLHDGITILESIRVPSFTRYEIERFMRIHKTGHAIRLTRRPRRRRKSS